MSNYFLSQLHLGKTKAFFSQADREGFLKVFNELGMGCDI